MFIPMYWERDAAVSYAILFVMNDQSDELSFNCTTALTILR